MKSGRQLGVAISIAVVAVLGVLTLSLHSQPVAGVSAAGDDPAATYSGGGLPYEPPGDPASATEAPATFDPNNNNNGLLSQADFEADRAVFEAVETFDDGLGPTYNAQSCRECHQSVVTGNGSQITELRSVRLTSGQYFASPGGSVIQSRATFPDIVERVGASDNIRAFRKSTSILGDGFVECVANSSLLALRDAQPWDMRGTPAIVPLLENSNAVRIGRFGWKGQQASLLSFAADAYLNEMGITSPLQPVENLSEGRFVGFGSGFDPLPEPEDSGADIAAFTAFMRSLAAPSRSTNCSPSAVFGERYFKQIGCAICHTPSLVTAPPNTVINGGTYTVPEALGNKRIHPYSDFLLHDVGTGDGIPIQPTQAYAYTANKMRTAPLWGLRTRSRLMHDGASLTPSDAIQRHGGQAAGVKSRYNALYQYQRKAILDFLDSL